MSDHSQRRFAGTYTADLHSDEVDGLDRYAYCLWLHLQANTVLNQGRDQHLDMAMSEIADRFECDVRTARRWAVRLELSGLVTREHRDGVDGVPEMVRWRLHVPESVRRTLDAAERAQLAPKARKRRGSPARDLKRAQKALHALEAQETSLKQRINQKSSANPDADYYRAEIVSYKALNEREPENADRGGAGGGLSPNAMIELCEKQLVTFLEPAIDIEALATELRDVVDQVGQMRANVAAFHRQTQEDLTSKAKA